MGDSARDPVQSEPTPIVASEDSRRLLMAVAATSAGSLLGLNTMPLWLGAIMDDTAMGEEAAGLLGSAETTAMFLASVLVAGAMARWSRSRTALVGAVLAVVGHVYSATTGVYIELVAGRLVAGAGEGLLMAAGSAAAAAALDPDRLFARSTVIGGLVIATVLASLPLATGPYGASGGFLTLAVVSIALAAFVMWLPPPREDEKHQPTLRGAPNFALAVPIMLALFVLEIGQGAVWAFLELVGEDAGLSDEAIGMTLSGGWIVGLSGAAFAVWLGTRYGRAVPLFVGIALNVGASVAMLMIREPVPFICFNLLWVSAFLFVTPYIMGALASLDDLGRWTAAGAGLYTLGDVFAPGTGGVVLERGGFEMLALLVLGTGLVALALLIPVVRRTGDPEAPGAAGGAPDSTLPS